MEDLICVPVLSIDPGLKHTATVITYVYFSPKGKSVDCVEVVWSHVWDLSGDVNPSPPHAQTMMEAVMPKIDMYHVTDFVIEFQPPINTRTNPALVRWNSWVEAYVVGYLASKGHQTVYSHPNSVKQYFQIAAKSHYANKELSIMKAQEYTIINRGDLSDHETDCVLMAIMHVGKTVLGLKKEK